MRYDTILFDADETLLDFQKAELTALQKVFLDAGFGFDDRIYESYRTINKGLWEDFEKGLIDKNDIVNTRFYTLFSKFGIEADGIAFNKKYIKALREGGYLLPGAKELCRELSKRVRLYLVTNGISKTQRRRLSKAGIGRYFSGIFVSEEIGFQKPQKGYFDHVFSKIKEFDPTRTIIVGDSLTSDIAGGNNAGIDTCWYNPYKMPNDKGVYPTYEIKRLEQIWEVCRIPRFITKEEAVGIR